MEALRLLREGNRRYIAHHAKHPHQDSRARLEVAQGQHPFAVVLGCADSRVAPEVVFDQGLGDLFVVRVAGGVVGDVIVGSIEFAATRFGVPLVMVLGHERCGAVQAALETTHLEALPAGVRALLEPIMPAVQMARAGGGDLLTHAIRLHTQNMVYCLRNDEILKPLQQSGRLRIIGGTYHLESGQVDFIV
jgi:carbonic anhydrase